MGKIFDNLAEQTKQAGQKNLEQQIAAKAAAPTATLRREPKSKGGRPVQTPGLKSHSVQFTDEEWGPIAKKARRRAADCGYYISSNASLMRAALRAFVLVEDDEVLKAAMREVETIEELGEE